MAQYGLGFGSDQEHLAIGIIKQGPVAQGINTRLGIYQGGMSRHQDVYRPDLVSDLLADGDTGSGDPIYPSYKNLYNAQDWTQLNDRIQDLVKKRSQLKQAVAKMIAKCCTFLDS